MFQLQTQQTLKRQDIIHRVHMIKGMGASHKKGGKMCKITKLKFLQSSQRAVLLYCFNLQFFKAIVFLREFPLGMPMFLVHFIFYKTRDCIVSQRRRSFNQNTLHSRNLTLRGYIFQQSNHEISQTKDQNWLTIVLFVAAKT